MSPRLKVQLYADAVLWHNVYSSLGQSVSLLFKICWYQLLFDIKIQNETNEIKRAKQNLCFPTFVDFNGGVVIQ